MKTLDVTAVRPFPDFLSHYPVTMWKTALLYAEKPAPLMDAEQMLLSRLKAQSPSKLRALGLSPEEIYEKPFRSRKRVVKSAAASRGQRDESAEKMGTAEGFVVENEHSLPATSIDNDLGAAILPSQFSNTSSSAILSSSMQAVSPPSSVSVQKQDTEKLSSVSRPETAEKGTEIDDPNMEETIRSCLTKAGLKKLSKSEKLLVEHIIRLGGDVDEVGNFRSTRTPSSDASTSS
ncbi:hypothetical protein DFJ73DRAFT_119411 [Zopfochytrium polystomum]|nr:hypothetical protein DFJ73DRAFT_119411 [Zopfochytrium polystomum]